MDVQKVVSTYFKLRFSIFFLLTFAAVFSFVIIPAYAADPFDEFVFQGILKDSGGALVTATKDITLKIYTALSGGTSLWEEEHDNVSVSNGIFTVFAGSVNSFANNLNFTNAYFLEVRIEDINGNNPEILSPRIKIGGSPFSLSSARASVDFDLNKKNVINATSLNATSLEIVQTGSSLAANVTNSGSGDSFRVNDATSDTTPFLIDGSGNVGIGTTSPIAKLDVEGSGRIKGSATSVLTGSVTVTGGSATVTGTGTLFTTELVIGDRIVVDFLVPQQTRTVISISSNESLTVDSPFDLTDTDPSTDKLPAEFIVTDSSGNVDFLIKDTGDIGIGTSSPSAKLTIETGTNDIFMGEEVCASGFTGIQFGGTPGTCNNYSLLGDDTDTFLNAKSGGDIFFRDGNVDNNMIILGSGNVGIGTITPSSTLEVSGNATFSSFVNATSLEIVQTGSTLAVNITNTGTGDSFRVNDDTADTTPFLIDASGNVGIGTSTPSEKFEVSGNALFSGFVNATSLEIDQTGSSLAVNITNSGSGDSFRVNDATSDTTPFLIDGSGNVGIATSSPLEKVYVVEGNIGGAFSEAQAARWSLGSTSSSVILKTLFPTPLQFGTSGTTRITILSTGEVGIGDSTPDDTLDVVGDLDVTSGCIQINDGTALHGTCASDARLKENIQYFEDGSLDLISQLKPASFEWREDMFDISGSKGQSVGFIAQDFEKVIPHLVLEKDGFKYILLNNEIEMHLIQAIKELKIENDALKELICLDHPEADICNKLRQHKFSKSDQS